MHGIRITQQEQTVLPLQFLQFSHSLFRNPCQQLVPCPAYLLVRSGAVRRFPPHLIAEHIYIYTSCFEVMKQILLSALIHIGGYSLCANAIEGIHATVLIQIHEYTPEVEDDILDFHRSVHLGAKLRKNLFNPP